MKKILFLFILMASLAGNIFAVPTWRAKDIDFNNYEIIKSNEISGQETLNLIRYIELDTPFFDDLLDSGYYDVKFDNGQDGIWFMFVNEGKIISLQIQNTDENDFICFLKEWKVKGTN